MNRGERRRLARTAARPVKNARDQVLGYLRAGIMRGIETGTSVDGCKGCPQEEHCLQHHGANTKPPVFSCPLDELGHGDEDVGPDGLWAPVPLIVDMTADTVEEYERTKAEILSTGAFTVERLNGAIFERGLKVLGYQLHRVEMDAEFAKRGLTKEEVLL